MASSRACSSACASRAPGVESVKGHDAALAADATAALQKSGVFSGNLTLRPEWEGCQKQADCSEGGTIGATCPGVLARSAASSAPPPRRHTPQPYSRRATRSGIRRLAPPLRCARDRRCACVHVRACVRASVCVCAGVCVCVGACVRACVFRELACSIGTNSHAAAEKVYAAASAILGEKLYCRLTKMTDAEVALEDPRRIAALLAAQNSAARSAGGRSLALCTHTHTHMCVCASSSPRRPALVQLLVQLVRWPCFERQRAGDATAAAGLALGGGQRDVHAKARGPTTQPHTHA
jgi:hypothetical protein